MHQKLKAEEFYKHGIYKLIDRWNEFLGSNKGILMIRYFYSISFFVYAKYSKIGYYIPSNHTKVKEPSLPTIYPELEGE